MNVINLGGKDVNFSYFNKNKTVMLKNEKVIVIKPTTCCIIRGDDQIILGEGVVSLHHKDIHNKSKGRFIAFKQAVSNIESKELRTSIWNDFRLKINSPAKLCTIN